MWMRAPRAQRTRRCLSWPLPGAMGREKAWPIVGGLAVRPYGPERLCGLAPPQEVHRVLVVPPGAIVEPCVLDTQRRQIGHSRQEVHVRLVELAALAAVHAQHADGPAMSDERHAGYRHDA